MKSRSRIWNAMVMGAIMAGVLALLPGTALAHGEHGEGWVDCTDSATAGTGDGDEPVSSDDPADEPLCHGVPDFGGVGGYAGTGGEEDRGGVAAGSGGTDDDGDVRVADCGAGAGGATAEPGGSAGTLRPDSSTADIDTSAADVGGFGTMSFSRSAAGTTGLRAAAAGVGCPRPEAAIGGTGDGFVAPNRIDAGAGGGAATSSNGPALVGGGGLMVAAALAALRRRARN